MLVWCLLGSKLCKHAGGHSVATEACTSRKIIKHYYVLVYEPIRIGPDEYTKTCWIAESKQGRVFCATNRQIWVYLGAPVVMDVYYIMIIIKTLKKIDRIFHFLRIQMILRRQSTEPPERAWFGCGFYGSTLSHDYGIPTCDLNDIMRSTAGLPKQLLVKQQTKNTCGEAKRTPPVWKSLDHR